MEKPPVLTQDALPDAELMRESIPKPILFIQD
jgi:hypothetical protein